VWSRIRKNVADSLVPKSVVESRDNVENAQDAAEDRRADNPVRVSGAGGCDQKNHETDDAQQCGYTVSQAIGQLFGFAVGDQVIL